MSRTVSLLTLITLFSQCYAAPRPLVAEELAAAGLDFPALDKQADNSTDSSWFPRFGRRQYEINPTVVAPVDGKKKPGNSKTRTVTTPLLHPLPTTTTAKPTTSKPATTTKKSEPTKKPTGTAKTTKTSSKPASSTQATSGPYQTLAPVPAKVQALYDQLDNGKKCSNVLDKKTSGYQMNGDGGNYAHYCGDKKSNPEVVYWMSNMDVDCDGATKSGPCGNDPSHLDETAFEYKGKPVDASTVPYVVINDDKFFSPAKMGIQGLGVVGVVCNNKLTWAVFADTNGLGSMGESSVKLAQTCFGNSMNGNNGHGPADVLYFAFTGSDAVDSSGGTNYQKLAQLGNSLLSRL